MKMFGKVDRLHSYNRRVNVHVSCSRSETAHPSWKRVPGTSPIFHLRDSPMKTHHCTRLLQES